MSKKASKAGKAPKTEDLAPDVLTLSRHGQAKRAIRSVRSYAGLAVFALVTLLSLRAGVPLFDAWMRGLIAGAVSVILAWTLAVTVWRHLAIAEIEAARRRMLTPPDAPDRADR